MSHATFNLQPTLCVSFHHTPSIFAESYSSSNLPFSAIPVLRNRRFGHVSSPKSASFDGYSLQSEEREEFTKRRTEDDDAEFRERIPGWIYLLRSMVPGGRWWSFSDRVEVQVTAKPVTLWRALRKMWELIAEDRWIIVASFSALILTALSEISIPHYLTASIFSAQSGDITVFHRNVRLLVLFCITAGICSGLRGCWFSIANMILVKRIREKLYSTLLLQGSGALIYLMILSWPLGFCTLAIGSTLSTIVLIHGQYQKKAAKLTQEFTASANEVAQETLSLMRTVRVYGTEHKEIGRYKSWLDKLARISLRQSAAYGFWSFSFNTLYHSTQVIAVLIGGMSILGGRITAEQLTKFILYSEWLIYSIWFVGDNLSSLMQSVGASEKVFQLMDLVPSDQFTAKGSKVQTLTGCIEFVDVSFYYSSREMISVLKHISFTVHPNEVVALVGLSGSGKSTLVNLLLRLYKPTGGQILIDGCPLEDLDIKWLRERIGYVGQEPRLFRMDISSNIRYGCCRAVKQEDVEWAARQAYAHDFISSLPDGYETLVDDDLLSGGQKQRIAIARAILREPTILILDEATSALDAESEYNVKGVLRTGGKGLKTNRSVLVIAHRLSTVQAADKIVVMDGGRIVEMGSHTELLLKDGVYARLARRQADIVA